MSEQIDFLRTVAEGDVSPVLPAHVEMALAQIDYLRTERDALLVEVERLRATNADLLAALVRLVEDGDDAAHEFVPMGVALDQARTAIARATGEAR